MPALAAVCATVKFVLVLLGFLYASAGALMLAVGPAGRSQMTRTEYHRDSSGQSAPASDRFPGALRDIEVALSALELRRAFCVDGAAARTRARQLTSEEAQALEDYWWEYGQ